MTINALDMHFQELNRLVKSCGDSQVRIQNCMGQRYIGSGMSGAGIHIEGTPGNALGAYLDGTDIQVMGNAQDATGDTMNDGRIVIHGNSGDATGYAMRGGKIFVKGSTGYRAGIHMKAYEDKVPVLMVGGSAGNFLGEYQAGGRIVVLGIGCGEQVPVGGFCGTGMHGGSIFIRSQKLPEDLPGQVVAVEASWEDLAEIAEDVKTFCSLFGYDAEEILGSRFWVLRPDAANPYKQMYVAN